MITNDSQLKLSLTKEIKKSLASISKNITDKLISNINSDIYSKPPSSYYDRTMQFLNAVIRPEIKTSGNEIFVNIGIDYTKIDAILTSPEKFNAHMSIDGNASWGGKSVAEGLLTWWDLGTNNNVLPSVPETRYWSDVFGDTATSSTPNYTKLQNIIDQEIKNGLNKFGISYQI